MTPSFLLAIILSFFQPIIVNRAGTRQNGPIIAQTVSGKMGREMTHGECCTQNVEQKAMGHTEIRTKRTRHQYDGDNKHRIRKRNKTKTTCMKVEHTEH